MRFFRFLQQFPRLGVAVCIFLALFTTWKLYGMCRLRGFFGTNHHEMQRVMRLWDEEDEQGRRFCMVAWGDKIEEHGHQNADCDHWQTMRVDDPVEIVYVGDSKEGHLRRGDVGSDNGNFLFDLVLFGLELTGILYFWMRAKEQS
jgi:hypothetical protein